METRTTTQKNKMGGGGVRWVNHPNPLMNWAMRLAFPVLKKVISTLLKARSFRENLFRYELTKKNNGKESLFDDRDWTACIWREFLKTTEFNKITKLKTELETDLDFLSREVIERVLLQRLVSCMESYIPFSIEKYPIPIRHLFPLDTAERERLIKLDLDRAKQYTFPCPVQLIEMAVGFGVDYFPKDKQNTLSGCDVIDGGGFVGDSAMIFTEYNPKMVHTFEPNPDTLPEIEKIIAQNKDVLGDRKNRIKSIPFALGKTGTTMKLLSNGVFDNTTSTLRSNKSVKEYNVPVISIDDYVQENSLNVGLIKLDVEGAESVVIEGALETIKMKKPLLIISIYHTPKDFFEIKTKIENLNLGYHFLVRHLDPNWPNAEICLLGYSM